MDTEIAALLLTAAVHVVAVCVLVWAMLDGERPSLRRWLDGPDDPPAWPEPPSDRPRDGGVPLPAAGPAPVRLRGAGRLRDAYDRSRRPVHDPHPGRIRQPA